MRNRTVAASTALLVAVAHVVAGSTAGGAAIVSTTQNYFVTRSVSRRKLAAAERVLLVTNGGYPDDVQSKLQSTGAFSVVAIFDQQTNPSTPSVALLSAYDAVLVWSNYKFLDPTALGDNLATYWDNGGRVVVAIYGTFTNDLQGRFGTASNGYANPEHRHPGPKCAIEPNPKIRAI